MAAHLVAVTGGGEESDGTATVDRHQARVVEAVAVVLEIPALEHEVRAAGATDELVPRGPVAVAVRPDLGHAASGTWNAANASPPVAFAGLPT